MTRSPEKANGVADLPKEEVDSADANPEERGDIPARILIVDDEAEVCTFLERVLSGPKRQVSICLSGQEAVAKLEQGAFDLVITDMRMPGLDGLDVLRKARQMEPLCQVIVITGFGSIESAVEVMKLGAYDYITKPFNLDRIRIVVDKALEMRALLRAAQERDFYKHLSQTDGLTEVYNYRALHEFLEVEIARSRRYRRPLSLLMIDLDDLKTYNDAFGHPAGDAILKRLALFLKKSVREGDRVARYGGDEFAAILPDASKAEAMSIAERLVRLVERVELEQYGTRHHEAFTVSIGLATYPNDALDKIDLVTKADQALYDAKALGGNRVVAAAPEGGPGDNAGGTDALAAG